MSRKGTNLSVTINGVQTSPTAERTIADLDGNYEGDTHYYAAVDSGKLCFQVVPKTEEFGEFYLMGLKIKEIRVDRNPRRWKDYSTIPPPSEGHPPIANWIPNKPFCPSEYFLTSRLKYKKLPPGQYIVSIRYQGKRNWDMQSIFLEIE
jgi:hypothetical protein